MRLATAVGLRNGVKLGSKGISENDEPVSIINEYVLQPIVALTLSGNPTVTRFTDCPSSFPTGEAWEQGMSYVMEDENQEER